MANYTVCSNVYGAIVDQRDESSANISGSMRVTWTEYEQDKVMYFEYYNIPSHKTALKDALKFFAEVI